MKKCVLLILVAVAASAVIPDAGEGCWRRRRCRPSSCPPVVYRLCPRVGVAPALASVRIKGKTYWLYDTVGQGEFEEPVLPATATAAGVLSEDTLNAKHRVGPKTTIVLNAPVEKFPTIAALLDSILTDFPDDKMGEMGITKTTETRTDAEKRNVQVMCFIHAFKKEADNDYHVIVGDGPGANDPVFMNVEVSGIPVGGTNANRQKLVAVRAMFKNAFNLGPSGPDRYKRPHEPIPVRITGSLFWDVDHPPGAVGPSDMKPKTSWEIHPISGIEFLEEVSSLWSPQPNGRLDAAFRTSENVSSSAAA